MKNQNTDLREIWLTSNLHDDGKGSIKDLAGNHRGVVDYKKGVVSIKPPRNSQAQLSE